MAGFHRQMAKSVADIVAEAAGAVTERVRQAGERLDVCVHPHVRLVAKPYLNTNADHRAVGPPVRWTHNLCRQTGLVRPAAHRRTVLTVGTRLQFSLPRATAGSSGWGQPSEVGGGGGGATRRLSKDSCTRCAGVKPLALHHLKAAGGSASAVVWDAHKELGTLLEQVRVQQQ